MSGCQRNMISLFLTHQGKFLLKCINDQLISPSISVNGTYDPDTLGYVKDKMLSDYSLLSLSVEEPQLRYVTMRWKDGELRQSFFLFAETSHEVELPDVGNHRWVPVEELVTMKMPATVRGVLRHYLEVGYMNDSVYCGVVKEKGVAISEMENF